MVKVVLHCDGHEPLEFGRNPTSFKALMRSASKFYQCDAKEISLCYFNQTHYKFVVINSDGEYKTSLKESLEDVYIAVTLPHQIHKFTLPEGYQQEIERARQEKFEMLKQKTLTKPIFTRTGSAGNAESPRSMDPAGDIPEEQDSQDGDSFPESDRSGQIDMDQGDKQQVVVGAAPEVAVSSNKQSKATPIKQRPVEQTNDVPTAAQDHAVSSTGAPKEPQATEQHQDRPQDASKSSPGETKTTPQAQTQPQQPTTKQPLASQPQPEEAKKEDDIDADFESDVHGGAKLESTEEDARQSSLAKIQAENMRRMQVNIPPPKTPADSELSSGARTTKSVELQIPDQIGEQGLVEAVQLLRGQELPVELLEEYWNSLGQSEDFITVKEKLQDQGVLTISEDGVAQMNEDKMDEIVYAQKPSPYATAIQFLDQANELPVDLVKEQWERTGRAEDFAPVMERLKTRGAVEVTNGRIELNRSRADEIMEITANNPEIAAVKLVRRMGDKPMADLEQEWKLHGQTQPLPVVLAQMQERGVLDESQGLIRVRTDNANLLMEAKDDSPDAAAIKLMRRNRNATLAELEEQWAVLGQPEEWSDVVATLEDRGVVAVKGTSGIELHKGKAALLIETAGAAPDVAAVRLLKHAEGRPMQELEDQWRALGHPEPFDTVVTQLQDRGVAQITNGKIAIDQKNADLVLETADCSVDIAAIKLLERDENLTVEQLQSQLQVLGHTAPVDDALKVLKERGIAEVKNGRVVIDKAKAEHVLDATVERPDITAMKLIKRSQNTTPVELEQEWKSLGQTEPWEEQLIKLQQRGLVRVENGGVELDEPKAEKILELSPTYPEVAAIKLLTNDNLSMELLENQWEKLGHTEPVETIVNRLEERGALTVSNGGITVNSEQADKILAAANSEPKAVPAPDSNTNFLSSPPAAKPRVSEAAATQQLEATILKLFRYDDNDPDSYELAQKYIPLVKKFLDDPQVQRTRVSFERLALLMRYGEFIHCMSGQPENAVTYFEQAVELASILYPTLSGSDELALAHEWLGRCYIISSHLQKAELHFQKSLEVRFGLYGEDHPDIAVSFHCLGNVYSSKKQIPQAIRFHNKSLEIKRRHYAPDDVQISYTLGMLAGDYIEQKDYEKALELQQEAYKIRIHNYPEDHPRVADLNFNMSSLYIAMNRRVEAQEQITKAYNIRRSLFGDSHYTVGLCKMNMAKVMAMEGKFTDAIQLIEEARLVFLNEFGAAHPHVQNCEGLLSSLKSQQVKSKGRDAEETKIATAENSVGGPTNGRRDVADPTQFPPKRSKCCSLF